MRWWIAAAAALVVAAGAVAVALHFRSNESVPAQAVRQYFADLAAGDTKSAMALVEDAGSYTSAANPLLSPAALKQPSDRPGQATITGTSATTANGAQQATIVTVTYDIDGTPVRQTIVVARAAGTGADGAASAYRLKAPFITVAVSSARGRAVKVNGIDYPAGASQLLAYPGAYSATVAGNELIAPATARATYDSSSGSVKAEIWMPTPAMAAGATAAVQAAVNEALDACAASTSPAPANCPFRYGDSSASMKWKVATYPKVKVKVAGNGSVTFNDGSQVAIVQYEATTRGFLGLFPSTKSGRLSVNVAGAASTTSSGVTVAFGPGADSAG